MTLQAAFALLTTLALSYWQLSRGFDKLEMRASHEQALSAPAIVDDVPAAAPDYQRVTMTGRFDQKMSFLVENRRHRGQPGYWVMTTFDTAYGRFLLNRGWISAGATLRSLPEFDTPTDKVRIEGVVWPASPASAMARGQTWPDEWPIRVRGLDLARMSQKTRAFEREVRMTSGDGLFVPAPLVVDFSTAKHWGYAVQWLLIGGLIAGGYWFFGVRRGRGAAEERDD